MIKKRFITLLFFTAYFLLAAHSFIPHQHDDDTIEPNHHHHGHMSDDGTDHNKSPLTDLTHNADFGKVIAKPYFVKDIVEKPAFAESIFILLYNKLASFRIPPRPQPPDDDSALHLIFLSHSLPLRAPPASSCLS
ncbi:MAG: hypothetical protein WKF97_12935 [Chitinophagaceae bacterium]